MSSQVPRKWERFLKASKYQSGKLMRSLLLLLLLLLYNLTIFLRCSRPTGKESGTSGGLGAALSQYSSTIKEQDQPSTLLRRRSSGGNLLISAQSRTTSFQSERRRAASPMFNARGFQDRVGSPKIYPSMLQNLPMLDPPEIFRGDKPRPLSIQRPLASRAPSNRERGSSLLGATPTNFYQTSGSVNRAMVSTSDAYIKSKSRVESDYSDKVHLPFVAAFDVGDSI